MVFPLSAAGSSTSSVCLLSPWSLLPSSTSSFLMNEGTNLKSSVGAMLCHKPQYGSPCGHRWTVPGQPLCPRFRLKRCRRRQQDMRDVKACRRYVPGPDSDEWVRSRPWPIRMSLPSSSLALSLAALPSSSRKPAQTAWRPLQKLFDEAPPHHGMGL